MLRKLLNRKRHNHLALLFLQAASNVVKTNREILTLLAQKLDVKTKEIFYLWAKRKIEQIGEFDGGEWRYFFHGLECDVINKDGRFLRIDFGPKGRIDTISGWGVLQYIMTSTSPWPVYTELQNFLADKPKPYDELSGSHTRMICLYDILEENGLVEPSDKDLCELVAQCTVATKEGNIIELPKFMSVNEQFDAMVCRRHIITEKGFAAIGTLK